MPHGRFLAPFALLALLSIQPRVADAQYSGARPRQPRALGVRDYASYRLLQTTAPRGGKPPLQLASKRPIVSHDYVVVKFREGAGAVGFAAPGRVAAQAQVRHVATVPKLNIHTFRVAGARALQAIEEDPNVEYAHYAAMRYPTIVEPNDPFYSLYDYSLPSEDPDLATWYKWDPHHLDAKLGWGIWPNHYYTAAGGKGADAIKIAVIDTGIDYDHPDFMNAGGATTNVTGGGQLYRSLDRQFWLGDVQPDAPDEFGHGTHVTGIAAASTHNGFGVTGNGFNAQVISLRVTDADGNAIETDLASAIVYAADAGALIVNISLGGYAYSQAEQDAVKYAWSKGTLVVAAAGNDGSNVSPNYPAALSRVFAVASTARQDYLATYSNWGDYIVGAAPGGDFDFDIFWFLGIYSTMPTYYVTLNGPDYGALNDFDYLMGTSMASPQVTGLAALYAGMKGFTQATSNVTVKIWQALQRGATGTGSPTWSPYYGYGRINIYDTMNLSNVPNPKGSTTGSIIGQLTFMGTPIANGQIVANRVGGGGSGTAGSRADGGYRIADVRAGTYNVTATVFGQSAVVSGVVVTAGCDIPAIDINVGGGGGGSGPGTLSLDPQEVTGGLFSTATLVLSTPAPAGGKVFQVSSSNPAYALPQVSSISFSEGQQQKSFIIDTFATTLPRGAVISCESGADVIEETLTINPNGPANLNIYKNPVRGGKQCIGTVTLALPAAADTLVTIATSKPSLAWPLVPSIVIPQGQVQGQFTIKTKVVTSVKKADITVTANAVAVTTRLTVKP